MAPQSSGFLERDYNLAEFVDSEIRKLHGLVMALVGSLLGFFLALLVPAICFLRSVGNATRFQIIMASAMIALGTTGAALGTYSSVSRLHQQYSRR